MIYLENPGSFIFLKEVIYVGGTPKEWIGKYPRHFDAPPREPGSIERRMDFMYMDGHGTFYRFDEAHYDEGFLNAVSGSHVTLVLYNLHTDQLDEVVFELHGYQKVGENHLYVTGCIAEISDYFRIKINVFLPNPMKSHILVYRCAKPDYAFYYGDYKELLHY